MVRLWKRWGSSCRNTRATVCGVGVSCVAAACISVNAHALQSTPRPVLPNKPDVYESKRLRLPPWAVSVLSGAIGEAAGQTLLYPVETVKVLTQNQGISALETLRRIFLGNSPVNACRLLFNGVGPTVVVSMLLGATYLGVFQASTRCFSRMLPPPGMSVEEINSLAPKAEAATAHDTRAAIVSAVLTSIVMATISGPLEMARNRFQAGLVSEPLLSYSFSARGLRDTIPSMAPFMLASIPHDICELMVYFKLEKCLESTDSSWITSCFSRDWVDAGLGAFAGSCGVLISAPADCIKTKLVTNFEVGNAPSRRKRIPQLWLSVARSTFRQQGVAGFFVGTVPRLLDDVPGSMLYWMFSGRCTRWLQTL